MTISSCIPREEGIPLDDAAKELGVSRDTIDRHVRRRQIPTYVAIGDRRIRIRREDFRQLSALHPSTSPSEGKAIGPIVNVAQGEEGE